MKVLMLAQCVDLDDPILGFTHSWIEKLARRVDRLYCVGLKIGRHSLDQSQIKLFPLGKEQGYKVLPDLRYLVNLYRALRDIERDGGVDIVFSHMAPIFAISAAPYAYLKRLPIVQWYAHPTVNWRLKLAHHFCARMVTSLPTAYRYKHDKVSVVGQGIDAGFFSPGEGVWKTESVSTVLCVTRLSPIKDLTTLLHATARLRKSFSKPFRVVIVGDPGTHEDENYVRTLKELSEEFDLGSTLSFEGAVPYGEELLDWYARCTVHVNLTHVGSGDKVALEAMSCGKLSLVCNEGFKETLGEVEDHLFFQPGDPEDLAQKLSWALSITPEERNKIGLYLRGRVMELHGLERLVDRLVELFKELQGNPSNM